MSTALLDGRPPTARVAWDVKADPLHYPIELRRRIAREADLLIFNREEVAFLLEAFEGDHQASVEQGIDHLRHASSGVLVLTDGARGSRVLADGSETVVPAERVEVDDPTGVGDAFFAAFLSARIRGRAPVDAGRAATQYAAQFLRQRATLGASGPMKRERTA
jgi:sugar/nucleoside kinase (ribokinase family)